MGNLVTVTVQVPEDRVPELYEAAALLNRPTSPAPVTTSPQPWAKGDERLAKQVFAACSPNAQKVLSYLAHRPGQAVFGADIATALAVSKGHQAIAGILGPVGYHCRKVGREMPYDKRYPQGSTAATFTMSKEVAEVFRGLAG